MAETCGTSICCPPPPPNTEDDVVVDPSPICGRKLIFGVAVVAFDATCEGRGLLGGRNSNKQPSAYAAAARTLGESSFSLNSKHR